MAEFIRLLIAVALLTLVAWKIWQRRAQGQVERLFALQHGCEPMPPWIAKWPLGFDFLIQAFWHARNRTILNFFTEGFELCAVTHEQQVLFDLGIATMDPVNVEAILSKQFEDFDLGLRPVQFNDLLGSGIFTQDGAAWKYSRNLMRPQFASNRDSNFEEIRTSVESLLDKIPQKGRVDLQPLFFDLTLDTTLFLLFGKAAVSVRSGDTEKADRHAEFANAFNDGQEYLTFRLRLGAMYWLINHRDYWRTCKIVHKFVDDLVEKALESEKVRSSSDQKILQEERYVFLDALVQQTRDKNVLRSQCLNLLLAGRDTTACCLAWTVYLLVRHPRCMAKLRHEIQTVLGLGPASRQPTREDLKRLPYLNLVIKEVLRLYPSVPVNVRAASRMTTLPVGGGPHGKAPVLVRKGQAITYSPYIMHRRKDIYGEDAHEFRPERWESDAYKDLGYAYIPFNAGPRACLGQDFALLEATYTIARLLQRFPTITLPAGEKVYDTGKEKQLMTLVVMPAEGCWVQCRASE